MGAKKRAQPTQPHQHDAKRDAVQSRPKDGEVRRATARAERMIEHLRGFVSAVAGAADRRDRDRLRERAAVVDRMWTSYKRTGEAREAVMCFVAAAEHAAALDSGTCDRDRPRIAMGVFAAGMPEHVGPRVIRAMGAAIVAIRGPTKWPPLLALIEETFGASFNGPEDLRAEYDRWRARQT